MVVRSLNYNVIVLLTYVPVAIVEFVVPFVANAGSVSVVVAVLRIDTIDVVESVLRKD